MSSPNFRQRLIPIGLLGVLLLLSAYVFGIVWLTHEANDHVQIAIHLDRQFQTARYLINEEDKLEANYRRDQQQSYRDAFENTAQSLQSLLLQLKAGTTNTDQNQVTIILTQNATYHSEVDQLFADLATGNLDAAEHLDNQNDQVAAKIATTMDQLANKYQSQSTRLLADLEILHTHILYTTPFVLLLGGGLILIFWHQLRSSQHRVEVAHQHEIARLESSALTDSLTGLGNHRAYQEDIHREMIRAQTHNIPLSLAIIDIDDFKSLNDSQGHAFGDQILQVVGTTLSMLSQQCRAYRIGGDEFVVVLPHLPAEDAMSIMQSFYQDQPRLLGAKVSMGISTRSIGITDGNDLKEQADAALYEAKRRGRNCIIAYETIQHTVKLFTTERIHALHSLLKAQKIQVVFQPIWDIQGVRLLAVEALSRPDPSYQFQSPQEAFDVAARLGFETELDALCRKTILQSATNIPPGVQLFINACPQSLEVGQLDETEFLRQVQATGLTPERITIEITERAYKNLDSVIHAIRRLRKVGFQIALDDIGSGNSGLEMMSHIAADYVKIDRGIIVKAMSDVAARGVLAGILAIAHETKTYVIAEGIETVEMLDMIRAFGDSMQKRQARVHGVQGYLLGKPSMVISQVVPIELQLRQDQAA